MPSVGVAGVVVEFVFDFDGNLVPVSGSSYLLNGFLAVTTVPLAVVVLAVVAAAIALVVSMLLFELLLETVLEAIVTTIGCNGMLDILWAVSVFCTISVSDGDRN